MSFKILFLGTGASDRKDIRPEETFCDKDKRRCSSVLLNEHVLIDCGPHVLNSLRISGIAPADITDIVFTHFHPDHFHAEIVKAIAAASGRRLNVWFRSGCTELPLPDKCDLRPMELFREYDIGGFKITGVPANHEAFPQHLSIEAYGKKLFYGLDGAWFLGNTVQFLRDKRYNAFVFDCTVGDYNGDYRMGEHNSIPMIRLMEKSLLTLKAIDKNTDIVLSHLAVRLHKTHAETCLITKEDGYIVAYDGMSLDC